MLYLHQKVLSIWYLSMKSRQACDYIRNNSLHPNLMRCLPLELSHHALCKPRSHMERTIELSQLQSQLISQVITRTSTRQLSKVSGSRSPQLTMSIAEQIPIHEQNKYCRCVKSLSFRAVYYSEHLV